MENNKIKWIYHQDKEIYYQLDVDSVLDHLKTSKEWLCDSEIVLRRDIYGQNILTELHHESTFHKILKQFKDALIILLFIAAVISLYMQDYRTATILTILLLANACMGYFQEAKAEKIMQSLKKMIHPEAKVKRNGIVIEVNASELVPGDVVFVDEGDSVPADLRIIEEMNLQTNDFSLTGESNPVNKYTHVIKGEADVGQRNNVIYMWTTVAMGSWYGVVFAIWMETELGRIAMLSHQTLLESTTLQNEMKNIYKKVMIGTIILFIFMIIIALIARFPLKDALIFAVGIAAAMIPNGLPSEVSIGLTLASGRLAKNNALVKQLNSVETLWCVNIICTDKTWTLTKNEMTVKKILLGGVIYEITWSGYEAQGYITWSNGDKIDPSFIKDWRHFFLACFLNSHAKVNPPDTEHQLWYAIGDPTEAALMVLAEKVWYKVDNVDDDYSEIYEFGFDSVRKMMSSVRKVDGETMAYVKWSCKDVLDHCALYYDGKIIKKLTTREREKIMQSVDNLAGQAMRNLAIAYKPMRNVEVDCTMESVENELVFLWIASIIDPPREEVPAAMQAASQAHIKVVMITWDSALTAIAIAKKVWLDNPNEEPFIVMGEDIKQQSDIQLLKDLENRRVIFCRTSPEDKLRIVSLLKKHGNIVAVTGDGINDAPALKMANIWVSMGKIWTDVAKEASEIVLLDDSFATLVYAIREWRTIFQNIKKSVITNFAANGAELFAVLPGLVVQALFGVPIAILGTQILMIDVFAELIPVLALTRDPPEPWLMESKPRDVKQHILNKSVIIDVLFAGMLMWLIAFATYILYFLFHGISLRGIHTAWISYMTATTVTYTSIVFCQYVSLLFRRIWPNKSIFTSYLRSNKKLLWAFLISFIGVLILVYVPVIRDFFAFGSMQLVDWLFPIAGWLLFLVICELNKKRRRNKIRKSLATIDALPATNN